MYTRHENTRHKHQKVKCPYCGENSNVDGRQGTIQFRICKNKHHFVYDSELEYLRQNTTNYKRFEEDLKHKEIREEELWLQSTFIDRLKEEPILMEYKNGQKTATRIKRTD